MDHDDLTFRDRMLDRYDAVVDWLDERTQGFQFSNFTDWRNFWALVVGSFVLVGIPIGLLQTKAGLPETIAAVVFWPAWIVAFGAGAIALGTVGVPKCTRCGKRLKAGYYTCRRCASISKPGRVR